MKQGDFTEVAKHYHNRPAYSPFLLEKLVACINFAFLPQSEIKFCNYNIYNNFFKKI